MIPRDLHIAPAQRRVMVCQISRGVAPSICIASAVQAARALGMGYRLIAGRIAVDAKNEAVTVARAQACSLVLIEDDALPTDDQWYRIGLVGETVLYGEARTRGGGSNVAMASDGRLLFTGTVLVYVPLAVLERMPSRCFEAWEFQRQRDTMFPTQPSPSGKHSDVFFWTALTGLAPRPPIESLGPVVHVRHLLNDERWALNEPCELSQW